MAAGWFAGWNQAAEGPVVPAPPTVTVTVTVPVPVPAFPAQPIQVDTLPDVWDRLGALGGLTSAIFAAGAFYVAYLVHRRQVEDGYREQALRVVLTVDPPIHRPLDLVAIQTWQPPEVPKRTISFFNCSQGIVRNVIMYVVHGETLAETKAEVIKVSPTIFAGGYAERELDYPFTRNIHVGFRDDSDRDWARSDQGELYRMGRRGVKVPFRKTPGQDSWREMLETARQARE